MTLTEDQRWVVELSAGRHLVLAPPGSGKTEMLSQRVLRALSAGVPPERMLCATFTNRAAFEMRDRLGCEIGGDRPRENGGDRPLILPEVGNLHHFCHRFLRSVGRLAPDRHVLDEAEQLDFIREVVGVLRRELRTGSCADVRRTHGVTVLRTIPGVVRPGSDGLHAPRIEHLREVVEEFFAQCHAHDRSPCVPILSAALLSHQLRIGIPGRLLRRPPPATEALNGEGVIRAVALAYAGLKRKFRCVDFDDLLNETYLYLREKAIPEGRKFSWVQIDEVQDLNAMEWSIVKDLTAQGAVSVYFGDAEQAIFSFLGATELHFADAVRDCERHFFRRNFRATPRLLEILMRYSLSALRSEWEFLPAPADLSRDGGVVRARAGGGQAAALDEARSLLDSGRAGEVALLVRRNLDADELEARVRGMGYRYAKVSGIDLFARAPMRDFMAILALFVGRPSRMAWTVLFRRFGGVGRDAAAARYLVREMFASGFDPCRILGDRPLVLGGGGSGGRVSLWALRRARQVWTFRSALGTAWTRGVRMMTERVDFRGLFEIFAEVAFDASRRYSLVELWPERDGPRDEADGAIYGKAVEHARICCEKFLRYAEHVYRGERRSFSQVLTEDWEKLTKLKEADLLVGDEQIVISTIHKAKGRQFEAVVVPSAADVLKGTGGESDEAARLLYVAMSRAKRHLILLECESCGELEDVRPCFEEGYENYYLRRAKGADLSDDWLDHWERLAAMCQGGICSEQSVDAALASRREPLVRLAVKVLGRQRDEAHRRRLRALLDEGAAGGASFAAVVIDEVRLAKEFDRSVMLKVRKVALGTDDAHVQWAALRYFEAAGESDGARARDFILDFLYFPSGPLRFEASRTVSEPSELLGAIRGNGGDLDRLAEVNDAGREEVLRTLLAAYGKSDKYARYATALRKIVSARALRGRA